MNRYGNATLSRSDEKTASRRPAPTAFIDEASGLARLNQAVLELFDEGLSAGNYTQRAFRLIARLAPTDLTGHAILDTRSRDLSVLFDRPARDIDPRMDVFRQLMHKYRPFHSGDRAVHPSRKALGYDHCFLHVATGPETVLFFGLFREDSAFHAHEKHLLQLAQPHLVNARRLALATEETADTLMEPGIFTCAGFTPRESQVLYWLAHGKTNHEIGTLLRVRTDTISSYLRTIYDKMGVDNRVGAALRAHELNRKIHHRLTASAPRSLGA